MVRIINFFSRLFKINNKNKEKDISYDYLAKELVRKVLTIDKS
jgi:hypothetical protein